MPPIREAFLLVGAAIAVVVGLSALVAVYRAYAHDGRRPDSRDALLMSVTGVVALALGGATLVVRPTGTTSVAVLGAVLTSAMAANAVLSRRVDG